MILVIITAVWFVLMVATVAGAVMGVFDATALLILAWILVGLVVLDIVAFAWELRHE